MEIIILDYKNEVKGLLMKNEPADVLSKEFKKLL
jgi:hypothetical protein